MKRPVFINDHLEGVYESVRASRRQAQTELDNAMLKEMIVDLIEPAGHALHVLFISGGEPKWRIPEERDALIKLSDALHVAFTKISGWEA
ncbi:hypothetical protein [Rhizobium leguminosarum]